MFHGAQRSGHQVSSRESMKKTGAESQMFPVAFHRSGTFGRIVHYAETPNGVPIALNIAKVEDVTNNSTS
jgi:hypothetical protein